MPHQNLINLWKNIVENFDNNSKIASDFNADYRTFNFAEACNFAKRCFLNEYLIHDNWIVLFCDQSQEKSNFYLSYGFFLQQELQKFANQEIRLKITFWEHKDMGEKTYKNISVYGSIETTLKFVSS